MAIPEQTEYTVIYDQAFTLIGSLRDKLADAVFSRNPAHRQKKLERIMTEIQKSVVQISHDDGETPRYENTRKVKFHHNKRSNL